MNAPKRWLDEGGSATPFERDLLRSGVDVDPPAGAQASVFAGLIMQLPPGAAGGGAASAAGAKGAATAGAGGGATGAAVAGGSIAAASAKGAAAIGVAGILKSMIIGAGVASVMVGTYAAVAPDRRSAPVDHAVVAAATQAPPPTVPAPEKGLATPAPDPEATDAVDAPPPVAIAAPSTPAPATRSPGAQSSASTSESERATRLHEESSMLSDARASLRQGNAAAALSKLEEIRTKFPGGQLGQEREALTIEALYRSGNRAAASDRANAFLKAYPTSPHASRIQPFASP